MDRKLNDAIYFRTVIKGEHKLKVVVVISRATHYLKRLYHRLSCFDIDRISSSKVLTINGHHRAIRIPANERKRHHFSVGSLARLFLPVVH